MLLTTEDAWPHISALKKIGISQKDKNIDDDLKKHQKLILLKTGLMQDLLTGKVRVTNLLNQKAAIN